MSSEPLPLWTELLFYLATLWALFGLFRATRSPFALGLALVWAILHLALARMGFYKVTVLMPPRPMFMILPPVLLIVGLVVFASGRRWIRRVHMTDLVLISLARIPVEVVLHQAWLHGQVPRAMTFEGTNFDILSGLSAPFMLAYVSRSEHPDRRIILAWNVICLLLLMNVVFTGILSVPSPIQLLNPGEPNRLILINPYVLLPAVIVPVVLWSHVAAMSKLFNGHQR